MKITYLLVSMLVFPIIRQSESESVNFVMIMEEDQEKFTDVVSEALENFRNVSESIDMNTKIIQVMHESEDFEKICKGIIDGATPIVIDLTWPGNQAAQQIAKDLQIFYVHIDISISPVLKLLDAYMDQRGSTDVTIFVDDSFYIDQSLYYCLGNPKLRMFLTYEDGMNVSSRFRQIVPVPHTVAFIAKASNMTALVESAIEELLKLSDRFILLFLDLEYNTFDFSILKNNSINIFKIDNHTCCLLLEVENCVCEKDFDLQRNFLKLILYNIVRMLQGSPLENYIFSTNANCESTSEDGTLKKLFTSKLRQLLKDKTFVTWKKGIIRLNVSGNLEKYMGSNYTEEMAIFEENKIVPTFGTKLKPVKRFFRVGTVYEIPWAYEEIHPITGEKLLTGYCMDLLQKISEEMDFDYEVVYPKKGRYGNKNEDGEWDGVVGDLVRGETEIAVSSLMMTAQREEVIDFVPPYFMEGGISIVMRKPVRKTSLFKFMTVLKVEVWLSILASLIVTAILIWFLDKYSPYSAKNNRKAYNYPCRDFTLKESFWFALTSFTPQGGGEAPKALSARVLVAAYWLFVVLMLATFTANLAAFLTVERMQTPVQSLEQLARQSRINYTVMKNSLAHKYFINMNYAEETLYRMWKELTLNASPDDARYRVWDYPIREQYSHILLAINDSMPVSTVSEGFRKVNERTEADFAFIHDSCEIKYEVSQNCNLTEVGEVFALKPFAIAIQQGSHLMDELSLTILELQKNRFLEYLQSKYWNYSLQEKCSNSNDSEGITLESLGGVFIATLFGLALAMVTLVGEVLYYRYRENKPHINKRNRVVAVVPANQKTITMGKTFQLVPDRNLTPQISYIPAYPRYRFTKFEN